jgi:hypothetical protein
MQSCLIASREVGNFGPSGIDLGRPAIAILTGATDETWRVPIGKAANHK